MSISGAMFNAYSGLVAASRTAETISQNVSNAMTDGYGRREVVLSAASIAGQGTGVRVSSISRRVDQAAISDRRLAQSEMSEKKVISNALGRLEKAIGTPGDGGSLSDLVTSFEAALVSAQSRPDSQARQQNILYAASGIVNKLVGISNETQSMRMAADKSIAKQVGVLTDTLARISKLNKNIRVQISSGRSANGLKDQRQLLVDKIADIIPIKTYDRKMGQIAIVSTGGAVLLEGRPAKFGFSKVGIITPDMTIASGALSGLTLNGKPIPIGSGGGLLDGGSLFAQFKLRDTTAPFASNQVDAFARNLMERFEKTGLDPSLSTSDPGLFTDGGSALDITQEVGLAGRIQLNKAVIPSAGGALWRLRDGLAATAPGNTGDRTLLRNFTSTLTSATAPASGQFSPGSTSLADIAGDLSALNGSARLAADEATAFSQGRYQELHAIEMDSGVNTDQEMQKLLLVEQAYAANARVVTTIGQMLKTLMGI